MSDPKIRIRRSSTPNKVPTITQLELGELAINTYDGKLYLEQDQGAAGVGNTVVRVNPWNVGVGTTAYNISFTSGKVGIGTTVAQYHLDVGGNINFTGNLTQDGAAFTSGVTVKDEGSALTTRATTLNFVGNAVAATGNGAEKTITITSGTGAQGAAGAAGAQGAQGASGGGGGGGASVSVGSNPPGSPSGGDLWWDSDVGELFIYYSDTDSNQWVETSGGSETVTVSDNAPSSPNHGDLWWESDTGQLKIYYNDGDSAQWVDANAGVLSSLTVWQSNSTGINTTSNVGIATTTATDALTVAGSINAGGENDPQFQIRNESGTNIQAFKHYFSVNKNSVSGNATNKTIVDIDIDENFHQAGFEVTYFTRLQAVSDAHTRPNKIIFGVNRYNGGGSQNVTKTVVEQHSEAASHCDVNISSVSGTNYVIRVEFSSTANVSSFAGGWVEGVSVASRFSSVDYYHGVRR